MVYNAFQSKAWRHTVRSSILKQSRSTFETSMLATQTFKFEWPAWECRMVRTKLDISDLTDSNLDLFMYMKSSSFELGLK